VGELFGQLLAFQFVSWLEDIQPAVTGLAREPPCRPLQLLETGAHDGQLALDILTWLSQVRPQVAAQCEYWILEPFESRRGMQAEKLRDFAGQVRWFSDWAQIAPHSINGVLFSNELLDAFPVFRIGWDAWRRGWFEWRVQWLQEHFAWLRGSTELPAEVASELARPFFQNLPSRLLDLLPDGFTLELSPARRRWWYQAAVRLGEGKLVTFDYGLDEDEFLAPHRQQGTLRSYRKHQLTTNPLAEPGAQDLTAHVNFTELIQVGESAGLHTYFYGAQRDFLTDIARRTWASGAGFIGAWSQTQTRQLQALTHPEHLGRSFRVLVQGT
jgi:SAM-dependent MidA family methyltransferase